MRRLAIIMLAVVLLGAVPAAAEDRFARRAGEDRFATVIAAGQGVTASTAIVVGDQPAADAAAGAAFAASTGAMLLIAGRDGLRWDVTERLRNHMRPGVVYVAGGVAAVPLIVDRQLRDLNYSVQRVAGTDRYDTAARLADIAAPDANSVVLASSSDPASACTAAASASHGALLLTDEHRLPAATAAWLDRRHPATVIGINVAAEAVEETVAIRGGSAPRTCVEIARQLYGAPDHVALTAAARPDAAIAAAYTEPSSPVLIFGAESPKPVMDYLRDHADTIAIATIYGGTSAVSDRLAAEAEAATNGCPEGSPDIEQPFSPFEIAVRTDRTVYGRDDDVLITLEACNLGAELYTQDYTSPLAELFIVDDYDDVVAAEPPGNHPQAVVSRTWGPGECTRGSADWNQHAGATLTEESHNDGPQVPTGSYRVRVTWNGTDGDPCHGRGGTFYSGEFTIA